MLNLHNVHQGLLEAHIHDIFPLHNIIKNTRKPITIKSPVTGGYLEVDIWLSDIKLCFEFQDDYHYQPVWYSQLPLNVVQHRDNIKRSMLRERGQSLITVPYWWDGTASSLQGTIHFHRPDLLFHTDSAMPPNPPIPTISSYAQLMLASFPADTNVLDTNKSWWIGEKWDGIRCFWNASDKQLYSRYNVRINVHDTANDLFNYVMLDGELWCGRGFLTESQNFISGALETPCSSFWRMLCFDEASLSLHDRPFETRYAFVLSHVPIDHPSVVVAPRFLSESEGLLQDSLQCVIQGGGEGLILRQPQSLYQPGRSNALIKLKAMQNDQEALVVKVEDDGSLLLQLPTGAQIEVPRKDCLLYKRPVRGDIATFTMDVPRNHLTQHPGVPANPIVHRIRTDLSWEDVLCNYSRPRTEELDTSLSTPKREKNKDGVTPYSGKMTRKTVSSSEFPAFSTQPYKVVTNRREFFDKFALSQGKDPLNAASWYNVTPEQLMQFHKGYQTIASYYGGRLSTTLIQIYPEIGLQESRFPLRTEQSWKYESERRTYFDKFAASRGANPLNPEFWYNITKAELLAFNSGVSPILRYYGGLLTTTLTELYPNIGLQKSCFKVRHRHWHIKSERRTYFDLFAAHKKMDPLNPVFWYNVTVEQLKKYHKGYLGVIKYHSGKLHKALMQLYPDIGLQKSRFKIKQEKSWKLESQRQEYFDNFAAHKGMDALNPIFWYNVTRDELAKFHNGYVAIEKYYGNKLSAALIQLYPDIGLQQSLFKLKPEHSWVHESARRSYFDTFAEAKGMEPLNPIFWYNITPQSLMRYNTAYSSIMKHHGDKLPIALLQLYPDIGLQKSQFLRL